MNITFYVIMKVNEYHYEAPYINDYNLGTNETRFKHQVIPFSKREL